MHLAAVRLVAAGGQPEQRRLAGPVRSDEPDPVAERDRRVDPVEDHERADLAGHPRQAEDAHRAGSADAEVDARAAARRVAAARFVRSVRARVDARAASSAVRPERPVAGQIGPAPARPARSTGHRPQDRRGTLPIGGAEALAPRAEMRRSRADDDPLDRPSAARTRFAGPLVDLQVLLHRAVAIGRRVVIDRASAPHDRLGQDPPDRVVQMTLVGGPQRPGGPQRMEPGRPQRLVGVDVADARDERLVEKERLEPPRPAAQPAPEVAHRELAVERLRTERREDGAAADLGHQLAGHRVASVEPDLPELADVTEAQLATVGELEDQSDVRVLGRVGRDDEQLAGHLQMDGQRRVTRQVDDDLLGAPPDGLDPSVPRWPRRTPRACASAGSAPTTCGRR